MSGNLDHSPARIVKQLLLDLTLGTEVTADDEWPVFLEMMPDAEDTDTVPANVITVYTTAATMLDRHMVDGEYAEYHGIQFIIRSTNRSVGYAKAKAILESMDKSILRTNATIGASTYKVWCMNRSSDVIHLGAESETRRRRFSLNYTMTVEQTA